MADTTKKRRPLTTKQRKFVKNKAKGMTGTAAAMDAYGVDEKSGAVIASTNLRKVNIQDAIEEAFDKAGISVDDIVAPIKDGLTAERVVIVRDRYIPRQQDDESDQEYRERLEASSFIDFQPDHGTRLKAADMAAKFLGIGKKPDDPDAPRAGNTYIFNQDNRTQNYVKGN